MNNPKKNSARSIFTLFVVVVGLIIVVTIPSVRARFFSKGTGSGANKQLLATTSVKIYETKDFSINYPSLWVVKENPTFVSFSSPEKDSEGFNVKYYPAKTESYVVEGYGNIGQNDPASSNFTESIIVLNSGPATRLDFNFKSGFIFHQTKIIVGDSKKDVTYVIDNKTGLSDEALFSQIYNSFKLK
jgi:hypothetical protein